MAATPEELIEEINQLRARLADAPKRQRALEERLLETRGQLAQAVSQNEKLSYTLREAREHIAALRDEVDKLTQPPSAYGVVVGRNQDGTVDVLANGRKMKVGLHPDIDHETLPLGSEVVLNDSFNVVSARQPESVGEVVTIREVLEDGIRVVVTGRADEERVCELADAVRGTHVRSGDTMRLDPRSNLLLESLPRPEVEDLLRQIAHDKAVAEDVKTSTDTAKNRLRQLMGEATELVDIDGNKLATWRPQKDKTTTEWSAAARAAAFALGVPVDELAAPHTTTSPGPRVLRVDAGLKHVTKEAT